MEMSKPGETVEINVDDENHLVRLHYYPFGLFFRFNIYNDLFILSKLSLS